MRRKLKSQSFQNKPTYQVQKWVKGNRSQISGHLRIWKLKVIYPARVITSKDSIDCRSLQVRHGALPPVDLNGAQFSTLMQLFFYEKSHKWCFCDRGAYEVGTSGLGERGNLYIDRRNVWQEAFKCISNFLRVDSTIYIFLQPVLDKIYDEVK